MKYSIQILTLFIVVTSLISCQDENFLESSSQDILKFESEEEYLSTVQSTVEMNHDELKKWELANNFNSKAIESLSFYRSVNFEKFKSKEELIDFVESNSSYLQIIDEDGELYVETVNQKGADRFILNKDNMYQIGDKYYKAYAEGVISGEKEQYQYLKNMDKGEFLSILENNNMKDEVHVVNRRIKSNSISESSVSRSNCGNKITGRNTSNRDRTKTLVEVSGKDEGDHVVYTTRLLVRPYKKTLGVWYHASRTITTAGGFGIIYYDPDSNSYESWYSPNNYWQSSDTSPQSKEEQFAYRVQFTSTNYNVDDVYFTYSDAMGDTPSTGPAYAYCL